MSFRALRGPLLVTAFGFAVGCSGEGGTGPSEPTLLEFITGQNQTGAVGTALATKIIVKASNRRGPLDSVRITMSTESEGGGSVSPRSALTGADGTAQFTWTLGGKLGTQSLTASTGGASPLTATISATATVGPASTVIPNTETSQLVVVGRAVPQLPSVTVGDGFGNPVAGVPVTFEGIDGASVLSGATPTTNAQGIAILGSWTIGLAAQVYRVRASIPNGFATAVFEARGIPSAMALVEGTGQSANAGTAVAVAPAVRAVRDDGSPLSNVSVNFTVVAGGGTVTGGSATTGADGIARPLRWLLGLTPGPNRLQAVTLGQNPILFDADGVAAVPAQLTATDGTALTGFFGNYVRGNPEVTVTDASGNPVAGVPVRFEITDGGGRVTQAVGGTDFLGRTATSSWRLGPGGPQVVTARFGALPPVQFVAQGSAPPAGTFQLEVRYAQGTIPNAAQQAAFDAAAARWRELILSGAPPYTVVPTDSDPSGQCPSMLNEVVPGAVIHVRIQNLGNPNILGATGLCVIRDEGFLPVQSLIFLNSTAVANLEASNLLQPVILHEMGHALGFGTLWDIEIPGLGEIHLIDGGGDCSTPAPNPTFNGLAARAAFYGSVADGSTFIGAPIPIENTSGCGTAYSHWRKTTFGPELLTGFLTTGVVTPLSAVSVQSMRDLGYTVNDAPADAFTLQALIQGYGIAAPRLIELPLTDPITVIDRRGRPVARVPRPFR
ncbi:MAG: leishmanolysin-related zinc metalloendopeptidase [Gemmatimonadales bacterium]